MKTFVISLILALASLLPATASPDMGDDKAISPSQLPKAALQTINTHLRGRKIAIAKMEGGLFSKSYTVIFTNGENIEVNGRGH